MAKTFERIVIKDYSITAENGDHFEIKRGEKVITSIPNEQNKVLVFKSFWVRVPVDYFAGEIQFT